MSAKLKYVKTSNKTAKAHNMLRVYLNRNYYDLTDVTIMKCSTKAFRICKFACYHGYKRRMLLEKSTKIILEKNSVGIPFCFSWINHTQAKSWLDKTSKIFRKQKITIKKYYNDNQINYIQFIFQGSI